MRSTTLLCCAAAGLLAAPAARADVKPHALFGDGMVLQRGVTVPVWGTADPGEAITVGLALKNMGFGAKLTAGADGSWRVNRPAIRPEQAGGPYPLTIAGKNTVEIKDVYVGEVWVCSGQSNMEWSVNNCAEPAKVKEASANPSTRTSSSRRRPRA